MSINLFKSKNSTFLILIILSLLLMYIINYHNNLYENFNTHPNSNKFPLPHCANDAWRYPTPGVSSKNKIKVNQFSHYMPVSPDYTELQSLGPSVDGSHNSPENMFMFAHNECKPECCPSTFSCSGGCVCATKKQTKFGKTRGNNKTLSINNQF